MTRLNLRDRMASTNKASTTIDKEILVRKAFKQLFVANK
jgi:hypothetical protein